MWPSKHVKKRRFQQLTKKRRLSHVFHEYQHVYQYPNNSLSGDQLLQVLNYQLATLKPTKWNLSVGNLIQPKDSPEQVDTWTTFAYKNYIHVKPIAS